MITSGFHPRSQANRRPRTVQNLNPRHPEPVRAESACLRLEELRNHDQPRPKANNSVVRFTGSELGPMGDYGPWLPRQSAEVSGGAQFRPSGVSADVGRRFATRNGRTQGWDDKAPP